MIGTQSQKRDAGPYLQRRTPNEAPPQISTVPADINQTPYTTLGAQSENRYEFPLIEPPKPID